MQFLVAETIHYVVESDDGTAAIAARKKGEGEAKPENNSYRASAWENNKSIPSHQWPPWAKALACFSKPEDKGIGDVVARIIGNENSVKFKAWHLATFGKPCGCSGRQRGLNIKYVLP